MHVVPVITHKKRRLNTGMTIMLAMPVLSFTVSDQATAEPLQNNVRQSEALMVFDISAKPLDDALNDFSAVTDWQIGFPAELAENAKSSSVNGRYTASQALTLLLADSGLVSQVTGDKSITLVRRQAVNTPTKTSVEAKTAPIKNKPAEPKQQVNDNSVFELGEMVVTAAPSGQFKSRDILSSVDIMNADKIENQNVINTYDLMHRMPGVQITQFNQGITTGKFSFRGFNGEGYVNGVKLLIDGIPSNTNDGNMPFIDALFPLDIESIEVVRGTNDPRYGLHAIAGNANINTYTGGNYAKGRVSYGSFDSHDVQSGLGYEKDGFSQNYAISYRATNGYRDHASSDKNSFSGKWAYTPEDEKYTVGLSARWSEAEADEPGYLTYKEQLASRTQSMPRNATDGGNRQVGQISGHLDVNLTDELFWSTKSYANSYDDSRFVTFYEGFTQQERLTEEMQYGAITSLTYRPVVSWLNDFSLESGFDFQQQDNKSDRYRTDQRVRRLDKHIRDQEFDFLVYGGYLQAVIKPTEWLKITPGFRADRIDGDFVSHRASSGAAQYLSAKANDYGTIWQPKIGAVITPIDGYSLYGNWGRTFQVAVGASTYKGVVTAPDTAPSINEGWEVGVKVQPVKWAEGRVAYWRQDATNESSRDLLSADNSSIPVGATKRQGVDVQAKINPIEAVSVWATYSLQEAIVTKAPIGGTYKYQVGSQVFNTPDYLFSAGIDYQITSALKSSLWTSGQGDYFVNSANTGGEFGEYALLNLDLGYQLTKQVDLQFQVKNLADTQWEYVWYEGVPEATGPLFSPGDGRAFYGAINVKFDI